MIQVVGAVFLLGILIFVHEFGHFLAMKAFGVKVLKFSLGFGRAIPGLRFTRGDTEYQVSWIPLGGYVKALGEDPAEAVELGERSRALREVARWKQIVIYAAGPVFNLLLPLLLFFIVYLGVSERPGPFVGEVMLDSPAEAAGFQVGDRILSIDGTPVVYWDQVPGLIQARETAERRIVVARGGAEIPLAVTPARRESEDQFGDRREVFRIGLAVMFRPAVVGVDRTDSLAYQAGVRTGDRITAVDGKAVERFHQVVAALTAARGRAVELQLSRRPFPRQPHAAEAPPAEPETLSVMVPAPAGPNTDPLRGLASADMFLGRVTEAGIAHRIGLRPGDRIVEVQGRELTAWDDFAQIANQMAVQERPVPLVVVRDGARLEFTLEPQVQVREDAIGREVTVYDVGAFSLLHGERRPTVDVPNEDRLAFAADLAWRETWGFIELTVRGLIKMATGEISTKGLGGPIMIVQVAARAAEAGLAPWLKVLGLISIGLGLLNLLIPIPLLDSGQILLLLVESVRRRPISVRVREAANLVGFSMLILLMGLAFWNDLRRVFFGD